MRTPEAILRGAHLPRFGGPQSSMCGCPEPRAQVMGIVVWQILGGGQVEGDVAVVA